MGKDTESRWTIVCKKGDSEWVADIDPDDKKQIAGVIEDIYISQAIAEMKVSSRVGAA